MTTLRELSRLVRIFGGQCPINPGRIGSEGFLSTSQTVAQHLPYLRRYARALSGSQASGDAYVAATLETLIQDPKVLDSTASTRIALYRLFTKIWNSVALNSKSGTPESNQPVEKHLAQIAPMPRQAFLLVALEGLSEDDAAKVLDIDVPKLRELVEDSGRELAAEIATDVLIIEDETFIALDLEGLVEGLGHKVLGVARTHAEAIALAKVKRPGIILADIHLADGSSGLDAVNELLRTFEVPVIFITAFPERFLTGERPELAFPGHFTRRQMPDRIARHPAGIEVGALVADRTAHRGEPEAIDAALDRWLMQAAFVALARAVARRMAAQAARAGQHLCLL